MVYHNIYDSWSWTGGHADGEADLAQVALREAKEETGLSQIEFVKETPVSLEIITVDGHEKRGHYVPSHLHLNLTYLFRAEEGQRLHMKEDENSGVKWIDAAAPGKLGQRALDAEASLQQAAERVGRVSRRGLSLFVRTIISQRSPN